MQWRVRRQLAKIAEKDRWVSWTITPDDVEIRDHLTSVRLKWARFSGFQELAGGFLFVLQRNQGYFLPAHAFTWQDEARFVSDWARRRVAKYQKRRDIEVDGKGVGPSFNDEL